MRPSRALLRNLPSVRTLNGGDGFEPTQGWNFWTPVWGSQFHAMNEDPYRFVQRQHTDFRFTKPWETTFRDFVWTTDNNAHSGNYSEHAHWGGRRTADSAIEIEATFTTCFGEGKATQYLNPQTDETGAQQKWKPHHNQWIFLPPDCQPVACRYCRVIFKRKKGWVPGFDENLLPTAGVNPDSLDPILAGVTEGQARAGDPGTVPPPAKLKGVKRQNGLGPWHTPRCS
eukprot:TRINITY_DN37062_c0_g1_i1.p2 TRINITY_DN37062_c0_g1~~TRINITY_DN37062_c0_g1_i1.p2  ORF type:complete len:228 (+),score=64.72 TRINITY_DN37062_c0_g1_i1:61-744(+)